MIRTKETIRKHIESMLSDDTIRPVDMSKNLRENGADSLAGIELILQLEEDFCLDISCETEDVLFHRPLEEWVEHCFKHQNSSSQ